MAEGGHGEEHDRDQELARLRRKMEALELDNARLKEALQTRSPESGPSRTDVGPAALQPITVQVKAPTPAPRLGQFTGLKPSGGPELPFQDWLERVEQYRCECPDEEEICRRVKASLKGIASNQVKDCRTSADILKTLNDIYGEVLCTEDLYLQFTRLQRQRNESPSDFFSRLWEKFLQLNKQGQFNVNQTCQKVYQAFLTNIKYSNNMLALELRNAFGLPGVASPDLAQVLRRVRELEEVTVTPLPHPKAPNHPHVQAHNAEQPEFSPKMGEIDYEKLGRVIARQLKEAGSGIEHNPRRRQFRPRGPCYNCGVLDDHFARNCPNPANPNRVAKEKKQHPLN